MDTELKAIYQQVDRCVNSSFIKVLNTQLDQHSKLLENISQRIEEYHAVLLNEKENVNQLAVKTNQLKQQILALISTVYPEREEYNFDDAFTEFQSELSGYINSLDKEKLRVQDRERFYTQPGDRLYLKILKTFKRFQYNLSQLPVKTTNVFRELLKKEPKPNKKWHHKVPLKNLSHYYLQYELAGQLLPLWKESNKLISASAMDIRATENKLDRLFNQIKFHGDTGEEKLHRPAPANQRGGY